MSTPSEPTERLTFVEAAQRLGITTAAVRMRVRRGTLPTEQVGDERFVLLPAHDRTHADRTERDAAYEATIARLDSEVAYLRRTLDTEIEARRRADHLLAGALERLAALPAAAAPDAAVTLSEAPGRAKTIVVGDDAATPAASLWSRFLRWLRGSEERS